MTLPWLDPRDIDFMLDDCETWAVVGLSSNRARTAYEIASLLQSRGKRIVPVHPKAETVLGEQGYATLADIPFQVDVVDVFVRSELAGAVAVLRGDVAHRAVELALQDDVLVNHHRDAVDGSHLLRERGRKQQRAGEERRE